MSFGFTSKFGNPCERFIALCSLAKALITVKIVVPTFGSFDETELGYLGILYKWAVKIEKDEA